MPEDVFIAKSAWTKLDHLISLHRAWNSGLAFWAFPVRNMLQGPALSPVLHCTKWHNSGACGAALASILPQGIPFPVSGQLWSRASLSRSTHSEGRYHHFACRIQDKSSFPSLIFPLGIFLTSAHTVSHCNAFRDSHYAQSTPIDTPRSRSEEQNQHTKIPHWDCKRVTMPASMSAEEIKFLPMTPEVPISSDPMAAAGASTLKAEKEGPAVNGVKGVKEVSY